MSLSRPARLRGTKSKAGRVSRARPNKLSRWSVGLGLVWGMAVAGAGSPSVATDDAQAHDSSEPRFQEGTSEPSWEGAFGLIVHDGPAYPGSVRRHVSIHPGGFLRWGRYTLTGAGGFSTRRKVDIERGFGAELLRADGFQVRLTLHHDRGRAERESPELAGMGTIQPTLRARVSVNWVPDARWVVSGASTVDLLDRAGGLGFDAAVSRRWEFGQGRSVVASVGITAADQTYMQAWHGVSPQQAARSGYPAFRAEAGLRQGHASVAYRQEFGRNWSTFMAADASCLLGSAARSPLTRRASSLGAGAGLARRF